MNNLSFVFLVLLLFTNKSIFSQNYTTKVLNGEQYLTVVSLTQDYDNDGDLDIISSRENPREINLLENIGTKQFVRQTLITENLPSKIADIDMADFDNDGDIDYVVCFTNTLSFVGELSWFQRENDGTYVKRTIAINKNFIMADLADFNGDGKMDIVAVGPIGSDREGRLYLNEGNFSFTEQIIGSGSIDTSVDAGDIDNDGDIDIAFGGAGLLQSEDGAQLLINNGSGSFSFGTFLNCHSASHNDCGGRKNIMIVDLNNDGNKDILAGKGFGAGGLYWLDGSDNFEQYLIDDDDSIDLGGDFVVLDLDGNGLLDIVRHAEKEKRVSVLYQNTTPDSIPTFEREYIELHWNRSGNPNSQMALGDLDNDGDIDITFPEQGSTDHDISWFENIDGHLYKHLIFGELNDVRIPKMVDWDNDGDLDIFATVSGNNEN